MTCKNCGARLRDDAKVCTNCGAFIDDASGYTLLASDDRVYDVYSNEKGNKHSGVKLLIAVLVVALVAGIGAYFYFEKAQENKKVRPELTFSQGSGLINRNEKVVFVSLPENSNIEFIHGAALYDYDKTAVDELRKPLTEDYEYTKNIDSTFRAIFFDMEDFNVEKGVKHTYTVEMKFSFKDSDEIYTYDHTVKIDGMFEKDVSDFVFDHSMTEDENGNPVKKKDTTDYSFIYSDYWYTKPNTTGNTRSISAFKFKKDKSYSVTTYTKNGSADWTVETENGSFTITNGEIVLNEGGSFTLDAKNKKISEAQNGQTTQTLTKRKYNSIQNTEDFFGL